MRKLIVALGAVALLAPTAPAMGKTLTYKGKTKGGHTITFKRNGKKVWYIYTAVPTVCLSYNRPGAKPISGAEEFNPPGPQIVGKKGTWKYLQKPSLYYNKVTKHYEVTINKSRSRKGKLTGKLHLTFSFMYPTYPIPLTINYGCVGKTTFSAKPKRG